MIKVGEGGLTLTDFAPIKSVNLLGFPSQPLASSQSTLKLLTMLGKTSSVLGLGSSPSLPKVGPSLL